ncbi:MAG: 30S ribosome-binding factor RbfA [Bacilli bacterium]|nr:30S ribosome-binding factor RbfA [Bacilli bacterium]MBN2696297.1 30S ribosome-binding factor RbfA [Bacilli bacterium]
MAKTDRLETLVQRVTADIIANEVKDDLGFITITGVKITNELSYMYVFYSLLGDEARIAKTQVALDRAKGFIKNQIALRVKMRKVPELVFKYDKSFTDGMKVDDIIRNIK